MNNDILHFIRKGKPAEATSLVESALASKLTQALTGEKKRIGLEVYGDADLYESLAEDVADLVIEGQVAAKPQKTGLGSPEGQKLKTPKQTDSQKRQTLMKQVADQRQKMSKARVQAAQNKKGNAASNLADAKIAQAKIQAAQEKMREIGKKK